jgi:class 3 adenylate cyclase
VADVDERGSGQDTADDRSTETKTILFADVVDSTGLYDEKGDEVARRLLVQCLDLMTTVVEGCKGVVEDRIGDEVLCTFDEPDDAAHAASQLQQRVQDGHANGELECIMRIRVGMEHGPIMRTQEGLFGTTIHTAARLVALAKAGQILTTKTTLDQLGPIRRRMERFFDTVVLKGIASEQDIHELLWDTSLTVVPTGRPQRPVRDAGTQAVELTFKDKTIRVDATQPRITLGRDSTCTLRLDGSAVSRLHARVNWNRGKARVEDVSTNGTCVEPEGGSPRTFHHDGGELTGHGLIRCGCLGPESDAALVTYRCLSEKD